MTTVVSAVVGDSCCEEASAVGDGESSELAGVEDGPSELVGGACEGCTVDDTTVGVAELCGGRVEVGAAFDDAALEDADEGGADDGDELRDDGALVTAVAELADAPVPTGAFCRRWRAPSTLAAEVIDKMVRVRRMMLLNVRLAYMVNVDMGCMK